MQANLIISILNIAEPLYQCNRPVYERNQEFLKKILENMLRGMS